MYKLLLSIMLMMAIFVPAMAEDDGPSIEFDRKVHDFGTIREKDGRVSTEFVFTNTGTKPLVIVSAYASCGCTKPKYSEEPIQPGQSGKISVSYNPAGRSGEFASTVTVTSNDKKNKKVKLKLRGLIVPN